MPVIPVLFCALFGLVFGSFLNVCIERLPRHRSVVHPRSRCPHCGAEIKSYDNIPLLSWLLLQGRCRNCKAAISKRYLFVEAGTGGLFVVCYLRFGVTIQGAGSAVFCFLLLGLAFMDAETMLLPDAFTLPGIAAGMVFASAGYGEAAEAYAGNLHLYAAFQSGLAALISGSLMLLIRWLYWLIRKRQGLGLGDVKMLAMMAAWLRLEGTLLAFFLAVVAAAAFTGLLLVGERLMPRLPPNSDTSGTWLGRRIPLGSFLACGGAYCVFFGNDTLSWYSKFFP